MPLANAFLGEDEFPTEYFYELKPALCGNCHLFQIIECPDHEKIFNPTYPYLTGMSSYVTAHLRQTAEVISSEYLGRTPSFVVEIGSNDGSFLVNYAELGIRHLGVEPTASAAEVAKSRKINTCVDFFSDGLAGNIRSEHGPADVIFGANVIAHIDDLKGVASGVRELLADDGVFVFEAVYLGDVIDNLSYDQIYDEHVFTFSVQSVAGIYEHFGLELIDLEHLETQGGSMRYVLAPVGSRDIQPDVSRWLAIEKKRKLNTPETMDAFRNGVEAARDGLRHMIDDLAADGKIICGYGAAAKSTIVMNYCGLELSRIPFMVDSTPFKQNRFSPGCHIPVFAPEVIQEKSPDFALVFAWNHLKEIMEKEKEFTQKGGGWIVPVPLGNVAGDSVILSPSRG